MNKVQAIKKLNEKDSAFYLIFVISCLLAGEFIDVDLGAKQLKIHSAEKRPQILVIDFIEKQNKGITLIVKSIHDNSTYAIPLMIDYDKLINENSEKSIEHKIANIWNVMMLKYAKYFVENGINFLGVSMNTINGLDNKNFYFLIPQYDSKQLLDKLNEVSIDLTEFLTFGHKNLVYTNDTYSLHLPESILRVKNTILKNRHKYIDLIKGLFYMYDFLGYETDEDYKNMLIEFQAKSDPALFFNLDFIVSSIILSAISTINTAPFLYYLKTHGEIKLENTISESETIQFIERLSYQYILFINLFLSTIDEEISLKDIETYIIKSGYIDDTK